MYHLHARNAYNKLTVVIKAHANGRNKSHATSLCVVGQQGCVRLYGSKSLSGFKLHPTSTNKCQHCCGSTQTAQHVGPNNFACCRPTMLCPFAWALTLFRLGFFGVPGPGGGGGGASKAPPP